MASRIKIRKTWATIYFVGTHNKESAEVELGLNYENNTWDICTSGEESVSLKYDSIDEGKAKLKALTAAISYAETELKNYQNEQ